MTYTTASTSRELEEILQLQQQNLAISISKEEKKKEGFVTVQHDIEILSKMNGIEPHIIAKDGDTVIGYTLCMTKDFGQDIPVLIPLFREVEKSTYRSKNFIVMGQVCIDKGYRGQGVFRGLYQHMKKKLQHTYDILITEVAADNLRSLQAHQAIGFKTLVTHENDGIKWHLIHWNWE
ncbi:GNAT family N-acetyltransferase [Aquimarina sp. RZ0]|nr:GNAT family N-acetyltransferase [Aquimarina sp. RZ0]